ncbi:MAG: PLDc N-terminal domain-containing protein [Lachnospiraceae bacterium]|nr:PLDc N-terminal domain-containing protein [Lachnospiraceae bacterium]MDD6183091.1 PLDc N-terminal domain-containing protein [Lachnospiraceae bacterium]MDD7378769.1 PLDc N-terminal domain-containing protein [Lachnospiraceae bacterium]MDY4618300.1 PLDc N-terminal domain-containing protein [Lachnospiraceae bacterium]MDY5775442.1 PLDc N-terminal domain-containing protein [Lachnospiraceae bacterium]
MSLDNLQEFLPFLIPVILLEVILLIITLRHILTHEHYKRGNRTLWVIVSIVGMQFWGPILYFALGKEDG